MTAKFDTLTGSPVAASTPIADTVQETPDAAAIFVAAGAPASSVKSAAARHPWHDVIAPIRRFDRAAADGFRFPLGSDDAHVVALLLFGPDALATPGASDRANEAIGIARTYFAAGIPARDTSDDLRHYDRHGNAPAHPVKPELATV